MTTNKFQTQSHTTIVQDGKPIMSIWWPMSVLAGWIGCFIAGAGLLSAYQSSANCRSQYYGRNNTCTGGNQGERSAGIAFILIAIALKLVFWILIIMRCYQQRRRYVSVTTLAGNRHGFGNAGFNEQSVPLNQYAPHQGQHTGYHPYPQYAAGPTSYPSQVYQENAPLQTRYG